ncbi:putative disease resistance protein RGA3 [Telopea speciosissima]|uniref:putative disease resistance protein RGA3 n=1 Tax=Telopea speciosissima TaxID=54955 RepID=UPI001CC3E85B|nr:putative disease resistance protein RGA3 [Telopea speciosissima]
MMGTAYVCKLGILPDEDCWSVLRHYAAFAERQEEEREKLKKIGMELAKKCKGLPLSAKTLGSLLRFKKSKQDWQDVLESDKDIQYSKAKYEYYIMHDLIHDFAKSLGENECFTFTTKDTMNAQEPSCSRARHLSLVVVVEEKCMNIPSFTYKAKSLRTLKIVGGGQIPKVSSDLFLRLTCLRTLDLADSYLEELPKEIGKLIHLRYLNLSAARFRELPKSVTRLYNLQILILERCSNLCKLPKGIWGLVNLIDLDLSECLRLCYLPEGIGRLSRLRSLSDFIIGGVERGGRGCKIGELKDVNFFKGILRIIGLGRMENGNEAKMACLKNKQHLRALYLYFNQYTGVSRVDEEVYDEEEEKEEKEEEVEVVDGEDMLSRRRMEDVLESLQPHPNLEILSINDYPGVVFPNWMSSPATFMNFSNLVFLELSECSKCKQLPPTLGKLPSLETLVIIGMDKVKFMGVEFFWNR